MRFQCEGVDGCRLLHAQVTPEPSLQAPHLKQQYYLPQDSAYETWVLLAL